MGTQRVFRCTNCRSLSYHYTVSESKASQPGHLDSHVKQNELNAEGQLTCHIDPREHAKLVKIIVHKCTVPGLLNGTDVSLLWDTGALVSLISEEELQNMPDTKIEYISTLLQADLHLTAANGSEIPFKGWDQTVFPARREWQNSYGAFSCHKYRPGTTYSRLQCDC